MAGSDAPSRRSRRLAARIAVLALAVPSLLGAGSPAWAAPERQVVLVVVPELAYRAAAADPFLSRLARAGGLGLLTTSGGADTPARTALAIGAGRPVRDAPGRAPALGIAGRQVRVDLAPVVARTGEASLGLLGSTLARAGLTVGYVDPGAGEDGTAALAAMDAFGRIPVGWLGYPSTWTGAGGRAEDALAADVVVSPAPEIVRLVLERTEASQVLVVVVGAGASPAMRERGETVNAIVLAQGTPEELLDRGGPPAGLTSDTTRRPGVVAEVDVAPTVLAFLGVQVPEDMVGSPIRVAGRPPTELHARYLELQRVVGPVGLSALAFGLLVLAVALGLTFVRTRAPAPAARAVLAAVVLSASLLVAMLPVSWLPSFAPLPTALALAGTGAAVASVALALGRRDARAAVATVATVGLALVAADAALGWRSELTPMLGGGVLDGERFFGLGNAYAGVVLAGAVLGAARLPDRAAPWLLVAAAIFAGLPFVGADLGGCATLSAAAGLWIGLGRWRLRPPAWLLGIAGAGAGVAFALLAARVLPGGGAHLSHVASPLALVDRLVANARTTTATPAAWLLLAGLGLWLALACRTPPRLLGAFEADPRWRRAIVVLAACGLLGWVLNDTYGLAGSAFTLASAAVLAPALAARAAPTG